MNFFRVLLLTAVAWAAAAVASAQSAVALDRPCPTETAPSFSRLLTGTVRSVRQLPSRATLEWIAGGGGLAIGARAIDDGVTDHLSSSHHAVSRPGAILGGASVELGTSFGTYIIGRLIDHPCTALVAADVLEAQLLAEALTIPVKFSVRRKRPDEGSGFAFPSGHASVTFASATVLQQHFGWRVGVPAYAVASYVALSRVQMRRHFLSDVVFGAVVGIVSGKTTMRGRTKHVLAVSPVLMPGGIGASFTWGPR